MKKGFTLIELLVVIAIIGILSGISFSAMRSGGEDLLLTRSAYSLAAQIREVEEMAMSAKKYQGSVPPGGYGIYFHRSAPSIYDKAYIYKDDNDNGKYDGGEEIVSLILEKGTKINLVRQDGPGAIRSNYSANFKPPFPTVTFKKWKDPPSPPSVSEFNDDFLITISLESNPSKTRRIRINKAGLISIE